jgi:acetate kinase
MKILVINTGSSSIKYQLFDMTQKAVMVAGLVERIGEESGLLKFKKYPGTDREREIHHEGVFPDHADGLKMVINLLVHPDEGVISDTSEIQGIGHRVVHGGETFQASTVVNEAVLNALKENIPLAPLHNPANIRGIETATDLFPGVPQVAVFDTAFHQTIPPEAFMYAVPYELYTQMRLRRYGFHGTSHRYVAHEAAKMLGKEPEQANLITIHLGNGGSITAVQAGKSVDTSMGLTPLAGIIMGTRCGDIDPAIPKFLADNKGMGIDEIDHMLNHESGLKGICGDNDMRDIHQKAEAGDERAALAVRMFAYRIRLYIGAYMAVLGRTDALVFTAGIGENDPLARAMSCRGLEDLGVVLDSAKNGAKDRGARFISADGSKTAILVVPTNEELEIARQTMTVLDGGN